MANSSPPHRPILHPLIATVIGGLLVAVIVILLQFVRILPVPVPTSPTPQPTLASPLLPTQPLYPPVASPTLIGDQPTSTELGFSCKDTVESSRAITWESEDPCWGKLPNGVATTVDFRRKVIVTGWYGGDVYIFTADPGESVAGLLAATFRPVDSGWNKDEVVAIESGYHAHDGEEPACVRDADNGDTPVSGTVCPQSPATEPPAQSTLPTATPNAPLGLKYQFDAGCAATDMPMEYPACILQRVQAGELTGEEAYGMIRQLAAKNQALSVEDVRLTIPDLQTALLWCPAGIQGQHPPKTVKPLAGTQGDKWADMLFVLDRGVGGPDRVVQAAPGSKCWMVYRR